MIKHLRNNSFFKPIWFIVALNVLNISVDTPDLYHQGIPEDLEFNDQESLVEIVLEKVLDIEDAIPEYDDNDTEDKSSKGKTAKSDLTYPISSTQIHIIAFKEDFQRGFPLCLKCELPGHDPLFVPPPES